jgi:hypothetical protein
LRIREGAAVTAPGRRTGRPPTPRARRRTGRACP